MLRGCGWASVVVVDGHWSLEFCCCANLSGILAVATSGALQEDPQDRAVIANGVLTAGALV